MRGAGRALPLVLTCVEAVLVGSSRRGHGLPPLAWKLRGQRPCPQTSLPSMALGQRLPQSQMPGGPQVAVMSQERRQASSPWAPFHPRSVRFSLYSV